MKRRCHAVVSRLVLSATFVFCPFLVWGEALALPSVQDPTIGRGEIVAGTPLTRFSVEDALGRTITYYASRPEQPAPILLMLQGSGCATLLSRSNDAYSSSLFGFLPIAAEGRFTVVAVEKPDANPTARGGRSDDCGAEFNDGFTAESWLAAIQASLADARKLPWVDNSRTLVLGASEGAVMASLVASHDTQVSDVISISGSGTGQLFDFVALAYLQCFDRSQCLADLEARVADIRREPDSSTSFSWGHPFKRWTSFFRVDPAEELSRSNARIYMAIGTADMSVPALSQEIAASRLLLEGKDITVRRVPGGGHNLLPPDNSDYSILDNEYDTAFEWFWDVDSASVVE